MEKGRGRSGLKANLDGMLRVCWVVRCGSEILECDWEECEELCERGGAFGSEKGQGC